VGSKRLSERLAAAIPNVKLAPHWVYRKTARNYNAVMATAADFTIAEVEEIVELGKLNPDCVHTPGIFVDAIFQGEKYEKRIERRTVRKP